MNMRFLIVDDEVDLAEIVSDILIDKGFSCTICINGRDATRALKAEKFDWILTDLKMPEMSGLELCRWVRKENIITPIITMSGHETSDIEFIKLGIAGHLLKPFSSKDLLDLITPEVRKKSL